VSRGQSRAPPCVRMLRPSVLELYGFERFGNTSYSQVTCAVFTYVTVTTADLYPVTLICLFDASCATVVTIRSETIFGISNSDLPIHYTRPTFMGREDD